MLYDLPLASGVKTYLSAFAKPFAGRRPRVLFVNSVKSGREAAELMQLAELDAVNVTYDRHWDLNKWGFGDFYDKRGDAGDAGIMLRNVEEALCADTRYDCIVLPAINGWNELTPATRQAIYDRVRAGAGLVLIHPMEGEGGAEGISLRDISPLLPTSGSVPYSAEWHGEMRRKSWIPREHPITRGIPFELLPYDRLSYSPYEAAGTVVLAAPDGEPIAAVGTLGGGRVAAFGYYSRDFMPQHADYRGKDGCFNPITDTWLGASLPDGWNFMEAFYKLATRAIYWSAGVLPEDGIAHAEYADGSLRVVHSGPGKLAVEIWNRYGERIMESGTIERDFALPEALMRIGGDLRAELVLSGEDGVRDFHTAVIRRPALTELDVELELSAAEYRNGDVLDAVVRLSGAADRLEVGLVDDYGRLLAVRTPEPADAVRVSFPLDGILSGHVRVEAVALLAGLVAARAQSDPCVVTPESRKLDDFEVFMNPQNRGQGDLLPYVNRLFPQAGMTGTFVGDNRLTAMSGAHGLGVYWYNRKPYVENKERWLETGDKAYLVRTPCLNDEVFWDENRKEIRKHVERQKKYGPIAYFAQDEGSLTCYSDEMDFCFCELCLQGMRDWLKRHYGSLEAINGSWETDLTDWAEAVPLTREEARRKGVWTSWADHRRYMELVYTDAYRRMRDYIQERDPEGEVRMSGCQASTAYTGNDYDLLHRHVRYFEAYPVGGQYEFHRSFKHPDTILGGWFGYGSEGAGARHSVWNALFHGLTLCSIFWEYSILNPDFSFSRSARDFGEVFREIRREGIGKLLLYAAESDTLGIAVHYSMASVHGTNITGHKTFFEENRAAWSELLEDSGVQYRYLSSRQIEEGGLANGGVRLLILPYSLAIGGKESEEIEKFAKSGGFVLGDVQTGLLDEHCRRLDAGALDRLFGIKRLATEWEPYSRDGEYAVNPEFAYFDLSEVSGEEGPGVPRAEPATRAAGGTRGFSDPFSGYGASLVVNSCGAGYGIYLNFAAQPYSRQRKDESRQSGLRKVLDRILRFAGVERPLSVTPAEGGQANGIESFYYTVGAAKVFGLKKEVGSAGLKYDGLAKNGPETDAGSQAIRVGFPAAGHIYDIRSKRYVGYGCETQDELRDGDAKLYAWLPYKAKRLRLTPNGEGGEIAISLETEGPPPERTVFAVSVTRPDGEYCTLYSRNVIASGGSARLTVPFALSDAGEWRITAKDVLTGVGSECVVKREAVASAICRTNRLEVVP